MPVIRIAEIPNAGPRSVAASSANIGVPQFGGFQVNPQVAQLDGAAALSDASIRRGAQSMLDQTLEQDAFTAEAEAGIRLGQSISQFGQFAQNVAEKFSKAKDTADLARAETTMRAAFEKQQTEQLDLPVDQWEENWTRNLELTRKALSEIKVSNNAAAELAPSWDRWSQLSQVQIQNQSRKKQLEGFQMDVDANATMKIAGDDFTGAFAAYDRATKDGIFTPEEANMRKARIYDDQIRQAKEDNLNRLVSDMNADPYALKPLLERRSKGEDVPELGDVTPVQATTLLNNTEGVIRGRLADDDDAADQAVLTGEIKNGKELREKFPNLPERRLLTHESTMAQVYENSPARWAEVAAMRPKILTAIANYDEAKDDQEWSRYFEIKDMVNRNMPPGERGEFIDDLRAKRREGKSLPAPVRDAMTTLSKLADGQHFGKYDPKKLASNNPEVAAAEARKLVDIGAKHQEKRLLLEAWAKDNPAKAKDPEQVGTFLKHMMNPEMTDTAIDTFNEAIQERETEEAAEAVLDFPMQGMVPAFDVTAGTRDQVGRKSVPGARQVALDFNDAKSSTARGVEIVVPANATEEETTAAQAFTDELTAWYASKGVTVPNRGVKTVTGDGTAVPRFHTEPFFAKDQAARDAIIADAKAAAARGEPSEYAQLLVRTLGRVPGITFIAPHESGSAAGAVSGDYNERDFARKYIIPSLELIKQRGGMLASN
jgi:hypothetical protein